MRSVLKSSRRTLILGWLLPLVLLALPNCLIDGGPFPDPGDEEEGLAFLPGETPSSAIMCEIPRPLDEGESDCATADDIGAGISLAAAATALANGQSSWVALDWSGDLTPCNGKPRKIEYYGDFPDGLRVCLNCGTQISATVYPTPKDACIAKCKDLLHADEFLPHEALIEHCEKNAKVAINVDPMTICYMGACTEGGSPNPSWIDPRRTPEPAKWIDLIGTDYDLATQTLYRNALTSGGTTADFNAGAASEQIIAWGDAWVDFAAGDGAMKAHVLGVRPSFTTAGEKCFEPILKCPDTDPHIETVGFAIDLNADGQVYVLEPTGDPANPFSVSASQGPYTEHERFRIRVTDNINGTATISYHRLDAAGVEQPPFATNMAANPLYPLRVDTTFRDENASLENVTIVRIKPQEN